MDIDYGLSRRKFLGVAAAATAGAAVATISPIGQSLAVAQTPTRGNTLILSERMGTITYTQRDVPTRLGIAGSAAAGTSPTMGYLGGPGFPKDPTDLGPLVPLPGGWWELFEYLAGLGFTQIEFAGYGQNAGNPGGAAPNPAPGNVVTPESRAAYLAYGATLRSYLDAFGLTAVGNHGFIPNTWFGPNSAGGTMSANDYARFQVELEFANVLGMKYMGTGNDPTSANNRNIEPWDIAGEKWTALNELSHAAGIYLYPHNHAPAYHFLQDGPMVEVTENRTTGAPITPTMVRAESGKRLMQHYLDITDPDKIVIELDIYWAHVAQHQHRWYYDYDGKRQENIFDVYSMVTDQPGRVHLFHSKDGARTTQAPGVGNGYNIVPFGDGDINFTKLMRRIDRFGDLSAHNSNYEQDSAPGGGSDPGKSLRDSKLSAWNMIRLG